MATGSAPAFDGSREADFIARAVAKDETAIRAIITAHNRRLYRMARSIVRNDSDAEDVLQETYVKAFGALDSFRSESSLTTWLTRIVINEALQFVRRRSSQSAPQEAVRETGAAIIPFPVAGPANIDPERAMAQREICRLIEQAIDELPDDFRTVLIARTLEGLSVEDTAQTLGLLPETVKTRLFRARKALKLKLAEHIGAAWSDAFPFAGRRCERFTDDVVRRLTT